MIEIETRYEPDSDTISTRIGSHRLTLSPEEADKLAFDLNVDLMERNAIKDKHRGMYYRGLSGEVA